MKTIAACMVSLALIACSGDNDNVAANANPTQAATVDGDQSPPPISAPAPVIKHYYSLEDAGEYGYEQGLSEDDIKSGTATKPLIMVRYLGNVDGTYSVQSNEGAVRLVSSCEAPCDFVKSRAYLGDTLVKTMTIPNAEGSILWEAMEDAMNGFMDAPQTSESQVQEQPEIPAQILPQVEQPIKEANAPVSPSAEKAHTGPSRQQFEWGKTAILKGSFHLGIFTNCCLLGKETKQRYYFIRLGMNADIISQVNDETEPTLRDVQTIQLDSGKNAYFNNMKDGEEIAVSCKELQYGNTGHYALQAYCSEATPMLPTVLTNAVTPPGVAIVTIKHSSP